MNRLANYGRPWTPADDRELRALIGEGCSAPQIAARLGRSGNGVYDHARRKLGLRFGRGRKPDTDKRARVCDLIAKLPSLRAVSRFLGLRPPTVYEMVRRMVAAGCVIRDGPPKGSPGYNPHKVRFRPAHTERTPTARKSARTGKIG